MRLKNLNKIKKVAIRNSLIILIGVCIICLFSKTTFSYEKLTYKKIYASDGDTIWSIAKEEKQNNEYYDDFSIREIVFDIKEKNQLNNSELKIGQELFIPTY